MSVSIKNLLQKYKRKNTLLPKGFLRDPIHLITCGFGLGASPYFPGTLGTLLGVPIAIALSYFSLTTYLVACVLLFLLGIYLCGKANKDLGTDDHPAAVFDEIATFPITLIGIAITWKTVILAFILFRIFDMLKPWPISWVDKNVHGGFGVMLDDGLAALVTLVLLHLLLALFAP